MELLHKPDWEEAKRRYLAWWAGDASDRCMLCVTAPLDHPAAVQKPIAPDDPVRRWTDIGYIIRQNEYVHSRTFYGGESFPTWSGGYPGHTAIPAFLGCPTELTHDTGWWTPILTGDDWDVAQLRPDRNGRWWRFTIDLLKAAAENSRGRSIPSIGAFGGAGDTLAALRGSDRLLLDVVDCPERMLEAELYLMDMWFEVYDKFFAIVHDAAEGSTCWYPLWSPGKFYAAQCDFSYMISTNMFRRMFLPAIEKQTQFLTHTVYHVDGIGAFRHVEALCELPCLQCIQILPGAGKPNALHYMDTLKKVQRLRKNLWIQLPSNDVKDALENLSARGLCIATSCETEAEAKALLGNAKRWSRDRCV